ncbi:hypothetical protein Y033_4721 [Burkholderia pseudomallei MSHR435]|nr:hypothetical protein Y034_5373 [Burkholderia pseudomallei MSHR449]KGX75019.1 hypothetical protein Y033_4721 [Burkholderia pseudomallei MSHR435]
MTTLPAGFPTGCPAKIPGVRACANDVVYRFTQNPPSAGDLLSYAELGRQVRQSLSQAAVCKSHGISVFTDTRDANHFRGLQPNGGGQHMATATLTQADGLVAKTGKLSHHTWWPFDGTDRVALFK